VVYASMFDQAPAEHFFSSIQEELLKFKIFTKEETKNSGIPELA